MEANGCTVGTLEEGPIDVNGFLPASGFNHDGSGKPHPGLSIRPAQR
jgi:hypothetical protein